MRRLIRAAVLALICLCPLAAAAADRIALVVGMSDYSFIPKLQNTTNDARLLSDTLTGIGFDVTTLIDVPQEQLLQDLAGFAFRAETADLALIYFAGHGVEVQGENFLVPVDANVTSNRDVQRMSVSLKELLAAAGGARKMRIVILDSCRNNPFGDSLAPATPTAGTEAANATRGGGGLAAPTPDRGTLVAFAARDGQVALDGSGANSPFAAALADKFATPGLEISLLFRQVRDDVLTRTGNLQEPHTYGSLSGTPFYIAGSADDIALNALADRRIAWSQLRPDQELQLAALADTGDTRSMIGLAYMRLNPEGPKYNPSEAADLMQKAAAEGSAEAQYELAELYETGLGVTQNPARALELYRASADQDYADALNDLGFFYYHGALGLPQDQAAALFYFERAADQKHPQAMFNFAALIDDGLVAGKGPKEAAAYLYQALRSGSRDVFDILTEQPNMFGKATRQALQEELARVALYEGSIDGAFGPGTKRSIRKAYGLTD